MTTYAELTEYNVILMFRKFANICSKDCNNDISYFQKRLNNNIVNMYPPNKTGNKVCLVIECPTKISPEEEITAYSVCLNFKNNHLNNVELLDVYPDYEAKLTSYTEQLNDEIKTNLKKGTKSNFKGLVDMNRVYTLEEVTDDIVKQLKDRDKACTIKVVTAQGTKKIVRPSFMKYANGKVEFYEFREASLDSSSGSWKTLTNELAKVFDKEMAEEREEMAAKRKQQLESDAWTGGPIPEGTIFVEDSYGTFYQVVNSTDKMVTVRELKSIVLEAAVGGGSLTQTTQKDTFVGKPFTRKINKGYSGPTFSPNKYTYCREWDGKPVVTYSD